MATNNPVELLFPTYRRQVLALLLMRPDEAFHVREIARLTGVPPGSLHRELRNLADAGLLLREPLGNQVCYRANRSCAIYPELAEIFRKTAGLVDLLREALSSFEARIRSAFVFGSFARSEVSAASDIDLFIVGEIEFADIVAALFPLAERLGREFNPVVMTPTQYLEARRDGERFLLRVEAEPRLFVMGSDDDIGKSVPNRQVEDA